MTPRRGGGAPRRPANEDVGDHFSVSSSGYNTFLLKQKENSGSVTATFRDESRVKTSHTVSPLISRVRVQPIVDQVKWTDTHSSNGTTPVTNPIIPIPPRPDTKGLEPVAKRLIPWRNQPLGLLGSTCGEVRSAGRGRTARTGCLMGKRVRELVASNSCI